jgi:hypothetical protein
MTTASIQGYGIGYVDRDYSSAARGVPALNGFYFGYPQHDKDNHLMELMMLPGGVSTDLTPTADENPSTLPAGRAALAFQDDNPENFWPYSKDEYQYSVSHVMLSERIARRFQFRSVGDAGTVRLPLPPALLGPSHSTTGSSILALAGFRLRFPYKRERHIDKITVMLEDDGTITIGFQDEDPAPEDNFAYLIDVVRISGVNINIILGEASGAARGGERVLLQHVTGTDFVLRGFHFDYQSGDHHVREIGVRRLSNRVEVFFGDAQTNKFNWKVRWAQVGPLVNAPV